MTMLWRTLPQDMIGFFAVVITDDVAPLGCCWLLGAITSPLEYIPGWQLNLRHALFVTKSTLRMTRPGFPVPWRISRMESGTIWCANVASNTKNSGGLVRFFFALDQEIEGWIVGLDSLPLWGHPTPITRPHQGVVLRQDDVSPRRLSVCLSLSVMLNSYNMG